MQYVNVWPGIGWLVRGLVDDGIYVRCATGRVRAGFGAVLRVIPRKPLRSRVGLGVRAEHVRPRSELRILTIILTIASGDFGARCRRIARLYNTYYNQK